jgi:hypothetical protein
MDSYICPYCGEPLDPNKDIKLVPTRDYSNQTATLTHAVVLVICGKCHKILGVS